MATTIVTKHGTGVPANGTLAIGELAVDAAAGDLYTSPDGNAVTTVSGRWEDVTGGINYAGGSVGIGTDTPHGSLSVVNPTNTLGFEVDVSTAPDTLFMQSYDRVHATWEALRITASSHLFYTDGTTEVARITSSGFMGIGTPGPTHKLTVSGNIDNSLLPMGNSNTTSILVENSAGVSLNQSAELNFSPAASGLASGISASIAGIYEDFDASGRWAGALKFGTRAGGAANVVERMHIDSAGNVVIGVRSDVTPTNSNGLTVRLADGSTTADPNAAGEWAGIFYANSNAPGKNGLLVTNNWAAITSTMFSVGLTDPLTGNYQPGFEVDGLRNVKLPLILSSTQLGTGAAGEIYSAASDERLKENITDMPSVLARVNQLRPVNYEWSEEYTGHREGDIHGLVAQEVQPIFPNVITGTEEQLGLDNQQLTGILVKAIQELTTRLEALEAA